MFFGEQRINVFREMILSDSDQERAGAPGEASPHAARRLYGIFKAMAARK
jgi:hypothetical protein